MTTQRLLAAKYGMSRGGLEHWVRVGQWVRFKPPGDTYESLAEQQAADLVEGEAAHGSDNAERADRVDHAGEAPQPTAETSISAKTNDGKARPPPRGPLPVRPGTPPPPPAPTGLNPDLVPSFPPPEDTLSRPPAEKKTAKEAAVKGPGASVIAFPGARPPPPKPAPEPFPMRPSGEQAQVAAQMSTLRGVLTLQQIQQLERHERILGDFSHLLSVYLSPHEYVSTDGLDEGDAQEKLLKVQRAALSLLLPTENDSLQGALRSLTSAVVSTINAKRAVAGLAKPGKPVRGEGEDPEDKTGEPPQTLARLDTKALREVKAAMAMLAGEQIRQSEPPRPPPPEDLSDLRRQPPR